MQLDPWSLAAKGTEHSEQKALFAWSNMAANFGLLQANDSESYNLTGYAQRNYYERGGPLIPQLKYLFAIHNQGHGDAIRGARAAAEGVKSGVPDICLPIPMGRISNGILVEKQYGLYIELKRRTQKKAGVRKAEIISNQAGKTSDKQNEWIDFLRSQGYVVEVCYGWEEARNLILNYLGIKNS